MVMFVRFLESFERLLMRHLDVGRTDLLWSILTVCHQSHFAITLIKPKLQTVPLNDELSRIC